MGIREQLTEDLKVAMRAKDQVRLDTVRAVRGAITQKEADDGKDLTDDDILGLIRTQRKQRVEAIAEYEKAGRAELAEKEAREKEILEGYLPAAPDAAAMQAAVSAAIEETGASSMRDMGKVMQAVKAKLPNADGKELSGIVKAALS